MQVPRWLRYGLVLAVVFWVINQPLIHIAVDWLWFEAVGYRPIFETSLLAKLGMWLSGLLVSGLFLGGNLWLASRKEPIDVHRLSLLLSELGLSPAQLQLLLRGLMGLAVGLPALLFAGVTSAQWLSLLTLLERETFGTTDPVFGLDLGFFLFQLPFLDFLQAALQALVTWGLLVSSAYYVARDVFVNGDGAPQLQHRARAHLLGLAALLFVVWGASWWLGRYGLLMEKSGVVWGVGYTDLHARLPGYLIATVSAGLVALALAVATLQRSWRLPTIALVLYAVVRVLVVEVWPDIVQSYIVAPNELELERPFLEDNIRATSEAYGLDQVEVRPFEAAAGLTMDDIAANPLTVENVRVWDTRPLLDTYGQLQEIRTYYDFIDVDVDRYQIDGKLRQVMLSARELSYTNVTPQARSWVNEHFQYTHGYGLTMSPVNVVTPEGLPDFFIKDIPPAAAPGLDLPVERPEIYYGEQASSYVFVKTGTEEFDYPMGDQNASTIYGGTGGVPIGAMWQKLLFAAYFQDLDVLLSQYLLPESRVMFRRKITARAWEIAPFLAFDDDPYLVLADGRLVWMLDAYTHSRHYPYSEPTRFGREQVSYVRNSVKIVIDAYNGSVDLYIADPQDPLIRVYDRIFPGTFKPLEQMPAALQAHIRYPADLFDTQARIYSSYHMKDPTVFYNKEDMWTIPKEKYDDNELEMGSYYLIMKLPEEDRAEFILLLPFVPTNKDNMISWLAARCDGDDYGRLVLYQFPKQKLIYGPRQIEARIDQDPDISEMITLWSQSGSRVVRGNLLVIPIGASLMYVEPLYLRAESSQLPELKRVIVSYDSRIAMRQTLDEALRAVFAPGSQPPPPVVADPLNPTPPPAALDPSSLAWPQLAERATQQLQEAERLQREGDWAGYGEALRALSETLEALRAEAAPAPDPAP